MSDPMDDIDAPEERWGIGVTLRPFRPPAGEGPKEMAYMIKDTFLALGEFRTMIV